MIWFPDLSCLVKGELRQEDDMEVARAGQELNQEVNRLMVAMRDMLANIRFQEPPRDDNPYRDEEEWDWERKETECEDEEESIDNNKLNKV